MKQKKLYLGLLVLLTAAACTACSSKSTDDDEDSTSMTSTSQSAAAAAAGTTESIDTTGTFGAYDDEDFDTSYDESTATKIELSTSGASISGDGASEADNTVTITAAGTYILSGEYNGQVVVNAPNGVVKLVLNEVTITSSSSSAIYVEEAEKAIVTLADSTSNQLTDASTYTYANAADDEPDAALFSKDDLTINGSGSLTVTGNYNNGIRGKDDVVVTGGVITVSAPNNALKAKDSLSIYDGTFNLTTTDGDGIQVNNTEDTEKGWVAIDGGSITIQAGNDGIQAETKLSVGAGTLAIQTADGADSANISSESSYKGLKATGTIEIAGGSITVDSADDSIHANDSITISGGTLSLASGDDGVHADNKLTLTGGSVTVEQSYEGLEASVIQLSGGDHLINSSDDGLNAGGGSDTDTSTGSFGADSFGGGPGGGDQADDSKEIIIDGGTIVVRAEGDGVDSNGNVTMSGGTVVVDGPSTGGNGSLDYNGEWTQTGGTLLAMGTSDMAQMPGTSSSQASLGVYLTSNQSADSLLTVAVAGTQVIAYQPTKQYAFVVISSPETTVNASVTLSTGGSISGTNINGFVLDGTTEGATELGSYTISDTVTSVDQSGNAVSGNQMGMGGSPGGR